MQIVLHKLLMFSSNFRHADKKFVYKTYQNLKIVIISMFVISNMFLKTSGG